MSSPDSSPADPPPLDWLPPAIEELASDFPTLEIESLLAQGGMSAVYLARQRSLERLVVLKVLPVEIGADEAAAERFMREARVLAKLRDPGIVEIYDSGLSPGGHLYLVLEWEEGGDLRHWAQGEVSLGEALGVGESVCSALSAAHAESIIHGDIKPDNVFIDGKGRLKVGDFGLADFGGEGRALFHTPGYTAPEIIYGEAGPSVQSDCYAAAAMVFELIYQCVPPLEPEERMAALTSLPPAASRALAQMLADDPAKRPASAEACHKILADAHRALNAVPAPRRAPPPPRPAAAAYTPPTPIRRTHRRVEVAAESGGAGKMIAAVAALVITGGLWMWNQQKSEGAGSDGSKTTDSPPSKLADELAGSNSQSPPRKEPSGIFESPKKEPEKQGPPKEPSPPPKTALTSTSQAPPRAASTAASIPPAETPAEPAPEPINPALIPLRQKYTTALTNAAKAAEQAKEVPKLTALRAELALIQKGGSPPDLDEAGIPPELSKLRGIYRKEAAALTAPPPSAEVTTTTTTSAGKPPVGMPADAIPFNGKWYRFYPEHPTWHAARDKCAKAGGMLATIPDKATWDFVKGLIGERWVWLGASDEKSEGQWVWMDGTPLTLTKWQKDEPNNTGAKQHYLRASNKGWRDDEKQAPEIVGYVCEWRPK
jgi:serine/threonine protein kinase